MDWYIDYDENDNACYTASSVYHDDGSPFKYRLNQFLRNGKIEWTFEKSDGEVLGEDMEGRIWRTSGAAKRFVERREKSIIQEFENETEQAEST